MFTKVKSDLSPFWPSKPEPGDILNDHDRTDRILAFPLILLPGVALIVLSTSGRYSQIHEELHRILEEHEYISPVYYVSLKKRATYFRNSLVALYVSIALFAVGSIAGAIMDFLGGPATATLVVLICLGILCLIYASIELIRESLLSLRVIEHHLEDLTIAEENLSQVTKRE